MLQSLCKFINQSDVIHIMTSPIKKNNVSSEGFDRNYHIYTTLSYQTR
jgi:hypothetical protein